MNLSSVAAADEGGTGGAPDQLISQTDFEDGDVWGFVPGGGAAAVVGTEESGNHALNVSGSGSGTRQVVKTLQAPTDHAVLQLGFDWKPGEVSTGANSSEVLLSDVNGTPILRLAKAGGPEGAISYGVGTTGTDLSGNVPITEISTNGSWLTVQIRLDFMTENASITVTDKADSAKVFSASDIEFGHLNYVNQVNQIIVKGNRASGQTLSFTASLDNMTLYGSAEKAPAQGVQQIASIETSYLTALSVPQGSEKTAVIAAFPGQLDVRLESGVVVQGVPVSWDSADYNKDLLGTYRFIGTLVTDGIPNVENNNGISGAIDVTLTAAQEAPVIDGYDTVYYTDFGDNAAVVPVNWGFTTANAALSTPNDPLGSNSTAKLKFAIENQSGGRVASKTFDQPVKGDRVLLVFDWYPGKMNDKGTSANENGGEFRVLDAANNIVFTLNHTNNEALKYFAGGRLETAAGTGFTNKETWYRVEIGFNLNEQTAVLKLTDIESDVSESYEVSIADAAFDGSVAGVRLVGIRTSGNNQTWTTYLDNFGIYNVSIPDHTIINVDKLPYHRVYVNEKAQDITSIGLPDVVIVTLADGSKAEAAVSSWTAVGREWDPAAPGVYEFRGALADSGELDNRYGRSATIYVYNRLAPPDTARQTEWLDRGVIALKSENGIFVSWRLLADEYKDGALFNVYRNGQKLNDAPLSVTNYEDEAGVPGDSYAVEKLTGGAASKSDEATAASAAYLSIPLQKPDGGTTATGGYSYTANDASVGDLDGDGQYEVIVKWYPTNAIDSSQQGMTGPTIFDAYQLDGTLLWRINMGLNLTSGAHYHQFVVADYDGDGKSEMLIKTADGTTVYGVTDGVYDPSKILDVVGNPEDNGKWVNDVGHIYGGPEYITVFDGETGRVIDTVDYAFPLGDVASWGDTWHNRSDRFLAGLAYLDGVKPSAVYGRGYYERTTFVAYSLMDGKLVEEWTFDSAEEGRGGGLGYHSLATGDVDNDGYDEIIAGSLTLDHDGEILYAMDGEMGRELGSHGDALHVGAFDPDREGLHVIGVHEVPAVASVEYHDGATGETLMSYYGYVDAGRGLAANITSHPGYEFWGTGGPDAASGGGIYNVQGSVVADSFRQAGLSVNFALYWDGDMQHELLDQTSITKYNEATGLAETVQSFEGVVSNNGTKATPTLQADLIGDWREEVLLPTTDSTELRIYSTTIPTEYRLFTLMHDPVYRMGIAWQNTAYNQPPHLGFYLGEDVRGQVLAGALKAPNVDYTRVPQAPDPGQNPDNGSYAGGGTYPAVKEESDGSVTVKLGSQRNQTTGALHASLTEADFNLALTKAAAGTDGMKRIKLLLEGDSRAIQLRLPPQAGSADHDDFILIIESSFGTFELNRGHLQSYGVKANDEWVLLYSLREKGEVSTLSAGGTEQDRAFITLAVEVNGQQKQQVFLANPIKVTIPYTLTASEKGKHESLTVVSIDENGERKAVFRGRYVPAQKRIVFETDRFGQYAITFVQRTFADLDRHEWARQAIEALASKGIVNGTSGAGGDFEPGASITRADFVMLLVHTLGLASESRAQELFSDVPRDAYYADAVHLARTLGIVVGQGEDRFNPEAAITRQDMAVLTARALTANGYLLEASDSDVIKGYKDKDKIKDYALEAMRKLVQAKLLVGSGERLRPMDETNRAEAAVFLYRLYEWTF